MSSLGYNPYCQVASGTIAQSHAESSSTLYHGQDNSMDQDEESATIYEYFATRTFLNDAELAELIRHSQAAPEYYPYLSMPSFTGFDMIQSSGECSPRTESR